MFDIFGLLQFVEVVEITGLWISCNLFVSRLRSMLKFKPKLGLRRPLRWGRDPPTFSSENQLKQKWVRHSPAAATVISCQLCLCFWWRLWWTSQPSSQMINRPSCCRLLPSLMLRRTSMSRPAPLPSRSWLVTAAPPLPQPPAVVTLLHSLIVVEWSEPSRQIISRQCCSWLLNSFLLSKTPPGTTPVQVLTNDQVPWIHNHTSVCDCAEHGCWQQL